MNYTRATLRRKAILLVTSDPRVHVPQLQEGLRKVGASSITSCTDEQIHKLWLHMAPSWGLEEPPIDYQI